MNSSAMLVHFFSKHAILVYKEPSHPTLTYYQFLMPCPPPLFIPKSNFRVDFLDYFCPSMVCITEVLFEHSSFLSLHCYLPFPINPIFLHRSKSPHGRRSILHLLEWQPIKDQQCHQTAEFKSKDFILIVSILWISIRISMQYELCNYAALPSGWQFYTLLYNR